MERKPKSDQNSGFDKKIGSADGRYEINRFHQLQFNF